jgi:hypothetical protein
VNEATLKRRLVKELEREMRGAVVIRHEDHFTGGIPDLSVTWEGTTTWIEVKYDRPGARAKVTPLQKRMLRRLSRHGSAVLLTYMSRKDGSMDVKLERGGKLELAGAHTSAVAPYIRGLHEACAMGDNTRRRKHA